VRRGLLAGGTCAVLVAAIVALGSERESVRIEAAESAAAAAAKVVKDTLAATRRPAPGAERGTTTSLGRRNASTANASPPGGRTNAALASLRLESPRLDAPSAELATTTVALAGRDPAAPRTLALWQDAPEGARRIATARSDASGRFDFGLWPIPVAGIDLAVVGAGERPTASDYRRFSSPPPAPLGQIVEDGGGLRLAVQPVTASGVVLVHERATGRLVGHGALLADPDGRIPSVPLGAASAAPLEVEVVHVLPDGRRSEPRLLHWP